MVKYSKLFEYILLYKLYITLPEPDYSKCLSIIKELIRNEPKNIQYLEILAGIQEKKENFFEAIKAYKQILIIEPNNLDAKKKLNFHLCGRFLPSFP